MDEIHLAHNKGPVTDSCEYGNELSDAIKNGKFSDQLSDNEILRNSWDQLS